MSAGDKIFVDSNILLYWLSEAEPQKRSRAGLWVGALWRRRSGVLSWQVIHEFYSNAIRKLGVSPSLARYSVEQLLDRQPANPDLAMLQRAWYWIDRAQVNYWDALIISAAEQSLCRYLLSEDFQAGRKFGDVTHRQPVRTSA